MATIKQLKRQIRRRRPKMVAKIEAQWFSKMSDDVVDFVFTLSDHIDWKNKMYEGEVIREGVWKLLRKARRLK